MDKVDFSLASLLGNSSAHKQMAQKAKKGERAKANRKAQFTETMKKVMSSELGPLREYAPSEEALTELMDAVHSAGSDLLDRPFQEEILKYKRAVRNFVHYIVENSFDVEKLQTRRRGSTKIHVQVQVIDRKLEEMAAAILLGQATQLERVSKIDEIKGLLIDLTISGAIRGKDG